MTEWVVACGEAAAPARAKVLRVRLTGPDRNFRLEIDHISRAMAARIPVRLVDLLEIASCVFAADQSLSRGGDTRRDWGADWRRSMQFVIPVRDVDFWRRDDVTAALAAALSFLSEDLYRFEFMPSTAPAEAQDYLPIQADAETGFTADDVILFSGGLDSLAGAVETLAQSDRRVALVSHRSAPKVLSYHARPRSAFAPRRR